MRFLNLRENLKSEYEAVSKSQIKMQDISKQLKIYIIKKWIRVKKIKMNRGKQ